MSLPISVQPNSTEKNKTGAWRTFKPKVDFNKCTGCGICARFCPEGIIAIDPVNGHAKPKAVINSDYCKGCGICAAECPFKAIEMDLDKK